MPDLKDHLLYGFVPEELVARVQKPYVPLFAERDAKQVLDLGCGRGIFLTLLRDAGIKGVGVDMNAASVAQCIEQGFEAYEQDILSFLEEAVKSPRKFDGIFCSQLVEHLPSDAAIRMFELCADLLGPNGRFIVVTPNIDNPRVWRNGFWLDPTHVRPYPRELLESMGTHLGLTVAKSYDDPISRPSLFKHTRRFIRDLFNYGPKAMSGVDAIVVLDKN